MVVLKKLFPLTLFLVAGCWAPFFDEDLAASLALEGKLGAPLLSFEMKDQSNIQDGSLLFFPKYVRNPNGGFLVYSQKDSSSMSHQIRYISTATNPFSDTFIANPWVNDKNRLFFSLPPDSTTLGKIIFSYDSSSNYSGYYENGSSDSSIQISGVGTFLASGINYSFSGSLNGFAGGLWDNGGVLRFDREIGTDLPTSTFGTSPIGVADFPSGSSFGRNGTFFQTGDGNAFIICTEQEDGSYRTVKHATTGTFAKLADLNIAGKVVGLVDNSQRLLVRDGLTFKVYDQNGTLQTQFPGGSLQFSHDRFDPGDNRWYIVFSRVLSQWRDGDKMDLRVDVFEWPSDDLAALGN